MVKIRANRVDEDGVSVEWCDSKEKRGEHGVGVDVGGVLKELMVVVAKL